MIQVMTTANRPAPLDDDMLGPTMDGSAIPKASRQSASDRESAEVARRVGRYPLLRKLGAGGMGVVYAGYDEDLDRKVAVKLLRDASTSSPEHRTRVLREAQAMAKVAHPNVVNVYEVGESSGQVFIAMEFVEGVTLAEWQRGDHAWEEVLRMYLAAGAGLSAAHHVGLVHRDFKPDNVLLGRDGRPRVADFGLARSSVVPEEDMPQQPSDKLATGPSEPFRSPLTITGTILGTPAYMSPEQHRGQPADGRSDQFSFCVALYEALYKQLPFAGESLAAFSLAAQSGQVKPVPSDTQVPMQIEQALRRGLSADPALRFPSMAGLLAALAVDLQHHPSGAPRQRRLAIAVIVTAIMVGIVVRHQMLAAHILTLGQLFATEALQFMGALGLAWFMRRSLLQNSFHRGLVKLLLVLMAEMVGIRGLGLILGLTIPQVLSVEMLLMGGMFAAVAASYLPGAWPLVGLCVLASGAAAHFPAQALSVSPYVHGVLGISLVVLWSRAARDATSVTAAGSADRELQDRDVAAA